MLRMTDSPKYLCNFVIAMGEDDNAQINGEIPCWSPYWIFCILTGLFEFVGGVRQPFLITITKYQLLFALTLSL